MPAASHDGVSSGFGFDLFRRPHVGATSWNIFAQKGFNPFYRTRQPLFMETTSIVSNQILHSKSVQMTALGEPGITLVMQSSTNLTRWTPFVTNMSAFGENVTTQSVNSANRVIFYRAKVQ